MLPRKNFVQKFVGINIALFVNVNQIAFGCGSVNMAFGIYM